MRIGIIGAGSASGACVLALAQMNKSLKQNNHEKIDLRLTIISNPNVPIMNVGESMSPNLFKMFSEILRVDSIGIYDELELVTRYGARHTWENESYKPFDITYYSPPNFKTKSPISRINPGAHFSSVKFSNFIFKRVNEIFENFLVEIHDNIKYLSQNENESIAHGEINSYKFDYIIDCRGFPTKEELNSNEYIISELQTVNSVILHQDHKSYNHQYTEVLFHKNGWQFGINTKHRKAFGYLFNSDITTEEEALKHYLHLNKNLNIKESETKIIKWTSYYSKNMMEGRILKCGNKLYFFEPIQGIPLHHYFNFTVIAFNAILNLDKYSGFSEFYEFDKNMDFSVEEIVNDYHRKIMDRFTDIIALNYVGNKMDSDFWRIVSDNSKKKLLKSNSFIKFLKESSNNNFKGYPKFHPHPSIVMMQYIEGLNVSLEKLYNEYMEMPK